MDEPLAGVSAIHHWIVCICGFRQHSAGPTGMEQAWLKLRTSYERPRNGCRVSLHNWNDPWADVAAQIVRLGPADRRLLEICVVAYSWGVGHGALTLCRELGRLGINVRVLLSIDGVYHSRRALWRSLWSPLLGEPVLRVPANVRRVDFFRQQVNRPRGQAVVAEDPEATEVHNRGILELPHERIDDSLLVPAVALQLCRPRAELAGRAA